MNAVVAMSGGIDSSVVAWLLKSKGYNVTGVIMKIWDERLPRPAGAGNACFGPDEEHDVADAQRVCDSLGIPLRVVDCSDEFRTVILEYFRTEYERGRTPNPCVFCNRLIKFEQIQKYVLQNNIPFDVFATGHYARIDRSTGVSRLKKASDALKDQSYFLYRLTPQQLAVTAFPLGEMAKKEVREIARQAGLIVAEKEESQDFYAGDYRDLLTNLNVASTPGNIVDTAGKVLGRHDGIHTVTIGQRKGLGISSKEPLYVVALDPARNEVVLGTKLDGLKTGLVATDLNMFVEELPAILMARYRSNSTPVPCNATLDGGNLTVMFNQEISGITPGQSVVLYEGDLVVGGGVIERAL